MSGLDPSIAPSQLARAFLNIAGVENAQISDGTTMSKGNLNADLGITADQAMGIVRTNAELVKGIARAAGMSDAEIGRLMMTVGEGTTGEAQRQALLGRITSMASAAAGTAAPAAPATPPAIVSLGSVPTSTGSFSMDKNLIIGLLAGIVILLLLKKLLDMRDDGPAEIDYED